MHAAPPIVIKLLPVPLQSVTVVQYINETGAENMYEEEDSDKCISFASFQS